MTYIAPSIKAIPNAIDFCDEIIDLANSADMWSASSVGEAGEHKDDVRSSLEMALPYGLDYPLAFFKLAQTIYRHARQYSVENGFDFSDMENIGLLRYKAGEGFYDRHIDSGPEFPRACSALVYLNDVADGGGTWFDKFDLMVTPEKGKLIIFPANFPYSHQAMPPMSEDKYVAVTWFGINIKEDVFDKYYANHRRRLS